MFFRYQHSLEASEDNLQARIEEEISMKNGGIRQIFLVS